VNVRTPDSIFDEFLARADARTVDDASRLLVDGVELTFRWWIGLGRSDLGIYQAAFRTAAPALAGNDLSIVRRDGGSRPRDVIGAHETCVEDARFEARFLVNADVPARACAWLGEELRGGLLAHDAWCVEVAAGRVEVHRYHLPRNADELLAIARLTAAFARADLGVRARWRDRASAHDARLLSGEPLQLETLRGRVAVVIEPDLDGLHACVCVRAALARPVDERFEITMRAGALAIRASHPGATARRLTPDVRAAILALAPRLVHFDGRAAGVDLRSAEPTRDALEAAIRLVATLADEAGAGPYR
jgi:hypothetical protein